MTTKYALLGSVVWLLLVFGVMLGILYYQWEYRVVPRARFEVHAQGWGRLAGLLATVGCLAIWIPWAVRKRRERVAT